MDSLIDEFNELRLSAFSKSKAINSCVHDVTIGPESTIKDDFTKTDMFIKPKPTHETKITSNNLQNYETYIYTTYINKCELDRLERVQEAVNERKQRILNFSKQIQQKAHEQWSMQQKMLVQQMKQQEENIITILEQYNNEQTSNKQNDDQIVKYYHEIAEIRKQKDRELYEKNEATKIIEEIKQDQIECQKLYEKIIPLLKNCRKEQVEKYGHELNNIPIQMSKICQNCSKGKISNEEAVKAKEVLQQITLIYEDIKNVIAANAIAKQEEEIKTQPIAQHKVQQEHIDSTDKYVSEISYKIYEETQNYLKQTQNDYQILINDDTMKQFRYDCQKGINIPVNAISAANSKHLLDKYIKLSHLLSGKSIEIGNVTINASIHNQGIKYCTDLLAHKFVLQGDLTISSNPEAAFSYATIILSLWNDFPLFGKLLLGHFYKQCPYLIPMCVVQSENQTVEDFYKLQGYQYTSDGTIEKQDKYLKRLVGIFRLFSAIMVAKPKSNQSTTPYGIFYAWQWLSCILNLPPKTDVTATLLYVFFQNVGAKMEIYYRKQFVKVMVFVNEVYMPLLKKIDTGGPVTRLEALLQEYREKGHFKEPSGMLPDNFW